MANKETFGRRSPAESDVIRSVWEKIGSELIEEFVVPTIPGDRSRAREIERCLSRRRPDPAPRPVRRSGVVDADHCLHSR
jgi:hypothetical protein